ncbi:MAG: hypothetical protein R3Y68_05440 [Rikenellaceae bacterium]
MRRLLSALLIIVAFATSAVAQPTQHGGARPTASSDARNNFHEFQMKQIEEALKLEGDRLTRFRELYASYNKESRPKRNEGNMQQRRRGGEQPAGESSTQPKLSEEEIDNNIKQSFEDARTTIDTKERYYLLFREFLSPSEVNMIYEIERRSRERFVDELQRRGAGDTRR